MFIKAGKTDWNILLVVVFLVAAIGEGIFDFARDVSMEMASLSNLPEMGWLKEVVNSETYGWKIYRNQDYDFQIKYPKDWNYGPNILRSVNEPHLVFCPPELVNLESGYGCRWESKSVGRAVSFDTRSPILLFVEDWNKFKGETKEEKKNIAWCKMEQKKTVNNIEMEFIDCDGQKRVYWENPAGDHLYKLFLTNAEFSTEFQQMVSTFRFSSE
jgi:hypothetical protein